ncbi:MAG: hypothetical protein IJ300_02160, partial [Clostridia bacterium]|nr:hypothetical protein [Clostridia bacterium]
YGEGTLTFDMLIERPSTGVANQSSFMYLYNEASKKMGDVRFTDKNTWVEVKPNQSANASYPSESVTSYIDNNVTRIEFDTWYTCVLSVDMKAKSWDFEMKLKGGTDTVVSMGAVGYHTDGAAALGFRDVRFEIANVQRPRFYVDNWVTTREAFVVGTPTLASDGTNYTATVAIKNESTALETIPTLIVASYDGHGKLVAVNWANTFNGTVTRNAVVDAAPAEINLTCSVPVDGATTAKAFVWNSLSTLVPYTTPVNPQ